ncbi:MAG: hypothetical protein PF483_09700, partial [Halothiobacillus sp.]|nr:hypothetical protein [Halothiobacillus sp.]
MYRVKQLDTSVDLGGFSQWLKGQGVPHRISEEGGFQVLWLENPDHAEPVLEALDRFLAEPEIRQAVEHHNRSPVFVAGRWQPSPRHAPLVLAIIVLGVLTAWFTGLGSNQFTATLMFVDPRAYDWGSMA